MIRDAGTRRWNPWTRGVASALAVLLASGAAAPLPVYAASPTEPAGAVAAAPGLTVLSEPSGAAVYVDGAFQGETPLEQRAEPGEHRVRVVKDGYLENRRMVTVPSKGRGVVDVALTPLDGRATAAPQVDPGGSGGGGGSKKALLIGLGVVAAGAGVYFLTRNTNDPPTVAGVTANPATGLQGATAISFSAQASDPDNDPLTYNWNFGDGGTGSGATTTHVYNTSGTFSVSVQVSDGEESATGTGSVNIRGMAGAWGGAITIPGFGALSFSMNLAHSGSSVSGTWIDPVVGSGSISGSVSAPSRVSLRVAIPGFEPFTLAGNADANVNTVSGSVTGSGFTGEPFTMSRR